MPDADSAFEFLGPELQEVGFTSFCSTSEPCFVVAGSDNTGVISTENNAIDPANALVPSSFGGGTGIGYEEGSSFMLTNIASNTDEVSGSVFANFPTGTSGGSPTEEEGVSTRNPLDVCQARLGCS